MKKHQSFICCLLLALVNFALPSYGADTTGSVVRIYIDADMTVNRASGVSIEQGIRTALSEVDNKLAGRDVELVVKDHRANSRRSKRHLEAFLADDQALALFSGLHSPPLLANREFINTQGILVLDPWAAAGPITRGQSESNWIFRLSIDDFKAGTVITEHAFKHRGYRKPALLLEKTGWGKSNLKTMSVALKQYQLLPAGIEWFNWGINENAARIMLRKIAQSGADCVFLVANTPEGKTFSRAMASLPEDSRLPIISHWGITGGDFAQSIGIEIMTKIDLEFIQTSFSFINNDSDFGKTVFKKAAELFPDKIKHRRDIKAPTGFIHSYDLTRLLIAAIEQIDFSKDMKKNRVEIKKALENLRSPVQGLIKSYNKPFSPYTKGTPDAHEALSTDDFVMGRYGQNGEIILINSPGKE